MKQTLTTCDIRGCHAPALTVQYFERRYLDAAGSVDNDYGQIDLCHDHAVTVLTSMGHRNSSKSLQELLKGYAKNQNQ